VKTMELSEAMRTAATTRHFRPDFVADDVLYRLLDSARFAPSGGNRQGWRVILVRDQALRTRLKDLYLRTWRPFYQDRLAQAGPRPSTTGERRPGTDDANEYAEHMNDLPVHLVVLVEQAALLTPWPVINQSTIYPFVQNVLLAIRAEGLGAALTMLLNNEEADVKRLLSIPDGFAIAAHIGVGWPAQPHPTRLRRRAVEDFTSVDRFGGEPLHMAPSVPGPR